MKLNIEDLIGKSPKQLSEIKHKFITSFRFQDADIVQDYIQHCIATSQLVKKILRGQKG